MSLKGNLQSVDLANVLQMLSINQKEGSLVLFDGDTRKSIYFSRDGVSMLSRGRKGQDSLGRILLRYGVISQEQLQEALAKQQAEGKRLGEVLQEMGAATEENVQSAVRTQIEEEIYNLFIWKEAAFEFVEGPPPEAQNVPAQVTFNVNSLIMEAQRRADEWNYIRGLVPSLDEIYKPTEKLSEAQVADPVFHLPFAPRVLENVQQGRMNVHELIESSCAAKFEACKILALLLEQGAIEPVSIADLQALAQEATGRSDHAQAAKYYARVVDLGGATAAISMQLGYALEALDEPERASVYLKAAAEAYIEAVEPAHAFEAYIRVARSLPTDLPAVTQMVEIACNSEPVLTANRHEVIEAGRTLAQCLKELGRLPAALQILHKLAQAGPQDLPLRNMLVQAYQDSGMNAEAMTELEAMAEICSGQKNYDEAVRYLRRIQALDRNRTGLAKKIETLTRVRDRGKRFVLRIVSFASVLIGLGLAAWGVWAYLRKVERERNAIDRKISEALDPLRAEFDRCLKEFDATASDLDGWAQSAVDSIAQDVAALQAALKGMEEAQGKIAAGAQAILLEHDGESYPPDTLVETRTRPLQSAVADARNRRDEKLSRIADGAALAYAKARAEAEKRPIAQIPSVKRAVEIMKALGRSATFTSGSQEENGEKTLEQLQKYQADLDALQARADAEFDAQRHDEGRRILLERIQKFPQVVEYRERLAFQVQVTTVPEGAAVRLAAAGAEDAGAPSPRSLRYTATGGLRFRVSAEGFKEREIEIPPLASLAPAELREALPASRRVVLVKVPKWSVDLGTGPVDTPPVASPDGALLVVCDRSGWIHLVATADGTEPVPRYDSRSGSGFQASPVVTADSIYAASVDGVVVALDLRTLRERWRVEGEKGPGPVYGSPILVGERIVVVGSGGAARAWDARSGALLWEKALTSGTRRGLAHLRKGNHEWIVAFGEDGRARAVAPDGSEVIEVFPTPREVGSLPPPQFGPMAAGDKMVLALQGSGQEFALVDLPRPGDKSPFTAHRWGAAIEGAEPVGAAMDGEDILLLYSTGDVRRAVRRQEPLAGAVNLGLARERPLGPPAVRDGTLFVTTDKSLAAIRLQGSGTREVWKWSPDETTITIPATVAGRLAFLCTRDGRIHALLKD